MRKNVAAILVAVGIVGCVAVAFKLGGSILSTQLQDDIKVWLETARDTPWAFFAVVAVFVGLGFTGFPQFLLIGVTALVFGSVLGFVYSWVATMISASIHFLLAKRFGNSLLRRYGGERTNLFSRRVGERGILTSGIVRVVPSAPFIVVNCAAGVSHMPYWKFAVGTGLGTIPKTVIVAFMGGSFVAFLKSQDPKQLALVALFIGFWVALGFVARKVLAPRVRAGAAVKPGLDGGAAMAPVLNRAANDTVSGDDSPGSINGFDLDSAAGSGAVPVADDPGGDGPPSQRAAG